ncbi:MAG: type IX secretion system sortase PorU [Bacteroidales bacterium]|nr:type IX secretion system sortase PorU [Bacteroidales bacterium]
MYKLKFCLLILIQTIINVELYSQLVFPHRNIKWLEKKPFFAAEKSLLPSNETFLLYFEGSIYEQDKHFLPIYSELIEISQGNTATLENEKFISLTKEEASHVINIEKIPEKIQISHKFLTSRKNHYLEVSFIPLRKNKLNGNIEKMVSFDLKIIPSQELKIKKANKKYASQSVLSAGKWIKIKINKSGVYKLTFDELRSLGIDQPENVRVFGNGGAMLPYYNYEYQPDDLVENHILIKNNAVYFYGDGPVQWEFNKTDDLFRQRINKYSDYTYYFLSSDYNSGIDNKIFNEIESGNPATHTITTYTEHQYHESDTLNLISSGRLWVGEHFDFQTEYNFSFDILKLVTASKFKLEVSLLARSPITSSFALKIADKDTVVSFSPVNYDYTATYAIKKTENIVSQVNQANEITINLSYNKSTASSEGWLDYLTINAKRQLNIESQQLDFRNTESVGPGNVGQFQISNANSSTLVWDVSDPQKPKQIMTDFNGNIVNFKVNTDSLREFIAFDESMVLAPIIQGNDLGSIENQNLHGINEADMIIVSHPEFLDQAKELQNIHQTESGMNVVLLSTEQIYNEFSSGSPDVSAIRNFIKMVYDRAPSSENAPKYLCLFGDGSYDNKHHFSENTNYILTYQSDNSLSPTQSFVTDDFFGLLDDGEGGHEGLLDIGIGRIPVKTRAEAETMVQKIRNYLSIDAYGDWRNRICYIADDEDNNLHTSQADELSNMVKNNYPVFNIEKIYLDAYQQESSSVGQRYPDANLSINNQIAKGLLLMNYTGHGNENGLAEERVISIDQINKWTNPDKLPIFMTATCEFSRFDNYKKITAGEHVFLNPAGGAIAMYTTTRLVYANPNFELNKNFYRYVFESDPSTGKRYRLGDIMRLTKIASGSGINKRNFTLLGDPALEPSYARYSVVTKLINDLPVSGAADTLKAYEKVKISGEIQSINGSKIDGYNGVLYPVIYDKELEVKTLNNDGDGVFNYLIQNNQLFKGKASVNNGDFQFSFIVPKDIRYNVDTGKISYYSSNFQIFNDSKGSFKNVLIGGSGTNNLNDTEGPKIQLYLNDQNFVSGGISNNNPKLIALLSDESGINTTGNGIGHDLIATIDNKPDLQFKLNDYYESEIDDYTSGKINYSFPELEAGEHTLHLKAWDVFNNSAEDSIVFIVADSEKLKISHVLNYPNPFSTNTDFFFEHNRPNEMLEVMIHVFTVSGKIVKTIQTDLVTNGFRSQGINWDGRDDFGNKIGRGVYFYKLSVRTIEGEKADKIEKLLIL